MAKWFQAHSNQEVRFSSAVKCKKGQYDNISLWSLLSSYLVYSVRGLERSELGGSRGCPGRLWDRFLRQVYQNDSRHDAMDGV